ncbi:uncharacterized protein LOC120088573 [Benincasa hispida]|uniref:uncharacterized protein LOC120088573 n=1 Tax=Benincasa hispida TaxID=102211 RepID=UPI001900D907|nr:uncharacterized protein LOC120088573 [Benincasa hispida]
MNQSVLLQSPPGTRQQPLLRDKSGNRVKEKRRFAEVAGGTAAGCAAICCCFPCSMMNLLILTVYKVPVGLCKKVWNKRGKRRQIAKKNAAAGKEWRNDDREKEDRGESSLPSSYFSSEDMELEKEMWERFYGTGFWRTPSQRET